MVDTQTVKTGKCNHSQIVPFVGQTFVWEKRHGFWEGTTVLLLGTTNFAIHQHHSLNNSNYGITKYPDQGGWFEGSDLTTIVGTYNNMGVGREGGKEFTAHHIAYRKMADSREGGKGRPKTCCHERKGYVNLFYKKLVFFLKRYNIYKGWWWWL